MFNKTKCDPELGWKVHNHLVSLGLETPLIMDKVLKEPKEKIDIIEKHTRAIWETLGYDLTDDSFMETPNRIAKMMVLETMWGIHPEYFPKCTMVENKFQNAEMVHVDSISVMSNCEHHGVTIDGVCHVAYIPNDKVLGLSKINRIVEYFSRRAQVQERLTMQILETIKFVTGSAHVGVTINATHYCVKSRGVNDINSKTTTTALSGAMRTDPTSKSEYLSHVQTVLTGNH